MYREKLELDGRVAVDTSGARGIARAIAGALLREPRSGVGIGRS
jgi:NAD(P)-dependent dehydrogenase (short-subunit alcohol dehydrogenase family)